MVTLDTVSELLTVIVEVLLTCALLVAVTVHGAAHAFGDRAAGYKAARTDCNRCRSAAQVVVVPQQPVLQSAVLASLKVAVALSWTVASSLMVAEAGAMVTLDTVSVFVTVIVEVLLT